MSAPSAEAVGLSIALARMGAASERMRTAADRLGAETRDLAASRDEVLSWVTASEDAGRWALGPREIRVLVVDDTDVVREAIAAELAYGLDGRVVLASVASAGQAVAATASERFDCIVLDVSLPGVHGAQVADVIRSGPNRATPIVLISGVMGDELERVRVAVRAEAALTKPWTLGALADTVRRVIGTHARLGG